MQLPRKTCDIASNGFSIVPREKNLRIVGIVDTEPAAGFGGLGSGRVLIPLKWRKHCGRRN